MATKTKVFLSDGNSFNAANHNLMIFGGAGFESVNVMAYTPITEQQLNGITVDQNVEKINFELGSADYLFVQAGNALKVFDSSNTILIATIPVQQDGTDLSFGNDSEAFTVTLSNAAVMTVSDGNRQIIMGANSVSITAPYIPDKTAPVVSLVNDSGTSSTDGITNNAALNISGVGGKNGGRIQYSLNSTNGLDGAWTIQNSYSWWNGENYIPFQEGENTVWVKRIVDKLGNLSDATKFSFTLDTTAPTTPVLKVNADFTVSISGLDTDTTLKYQSLVNNQWVASDTLPTVVEGTNQLRVLQTDVAGNTAVGYLNFTKDIAPAAPTVKLTSDNGISATDKITNDPALIVSNDEYVYKVKYSVNSTDGVNGDWTTNNSNYIYNQNQFSEGGNKVWVKQVDQSGNESAATVFEFTLDRTAPITPTVSITNSINGSFTQDGLLTISGLEDGAKVQYQHAVDGNWSELTDQMPTPVIGNNQLYVYQTDVVGNQSGIGIQFNYAPTLHTPTNQQEPWLLVNSGYDYQNGVTSIFSLSWTWTSTTTNNYDSNTPATLVSRTTTRIDTYSDPRQVTSVDVISAIDNQLISQSRIDGNKMFFKAFDSVNRSITGLSGDDFLSGGAGSDSISGGAGSDTLEGGAGSDTLNGGAGVDMVSYRNASGSVTVNLGSDSVSGSASGDGNDILISIEGSEGSNFSDTITGSLGNDFLSGGGGSDSISGGAGSDTIDGGAGSDSIDGGEGVDIVSYQNASSSVTVDLQAGTVSSTDGNDTLIGIEGIKGSSFNDSIVGTTGNDSVWGNQGNDTLNSGTGNDYIEGGEGSDSIIGDTGNDSILGDLGNDSIDGGTGSDTIDGGAGNDLLTGGTDSDAFSVGAGIDTITDWATGDTLTISSGATAKITVASGGGVIATFSGISNSGTLFIDSSAASAATTSIIGSTGADSITGGGVSDTIDGGSGNDTISGGAGSDSIDGGEGFDIVSYRNASGSVTVNLSSDSVPGSASGADGNDILSNIENIDDSLFNDTLVGNSGNNLFNLSGGDDTVNGGDGVDIVSYQSATAGIIMGGVFSPTSAIATSNQSPTGESVEMAIDGNPNTKYLNSGKTNTGLTVTFSTATIINSIKLTTANDSPERNPSSFSIYGINANNPPQIVIENQQITLPNTFKTTSDYYSFSNSTAYSSYKIIFPTIQNSSTADSMQIADIYFYRLPHLSNIEKIIGSNYNDSLIGDNLANVIDGGAGIDTLTGGTGNDTFVFNSGAQSISSSNVTDVITDFVRGTDKIDFGIAVSNSQFVSATTPVANLVTLLNNVNTINNTAPNKTDGKILYYFGVIGADGYLVTEDDTGVISNSIQLTGVTALAVSDFVSQPTV